MAISSRVQLGSFTVIAILLATVSPVVLAQPAVAATCSGTQIAAGASIQAAIDAHGTGTTFCLTAGTYRVSSRIRPKSYDTFVGTGITRDNTTVRTSSAQVIFETDGTTGVNFRHFAVAGAINACPGSNCGETGTGISRGTSVTVDDMHLYNNGLNGVGGGNGTLTVKNSEIDHNGAAIDGVSGGIKRIDPLTVTNSYIHDNKGNGIWCDMQCGSFIVTGSTVTGNTGGGIFDEISEGSSVIANNIVKGNNTTNSYNLGGISVVDSKNVNIYGNTLGGNIRFGIGAAMDSRVNCGTPTSRCGYVLSNVSIHDNTPNGDALQGCSLTGVTCTRNP